MRRERTLRPGWWMTGNAWVDQDGYHVWAAHDCLTERVVTMLPFPDWHLAGEGVEPSFTCSLCGFHSILTLGEPEVTA